MDSQIEQEVEFGRHHYHYFDEFEGSFVLISPSENISTAIVFVHGFGGNSLGTWDKFQLMVDDPYWTASFFEADLFFFQYKSVWERIHSSTDRFLKFLDQVVFAGDPSHFVVDLIPLLVSPESGSVGTQASEISALPAVRRYQRVVLVGHSEGGVVIRNGIDKKAKGHSQILRSELRLFAPAIGGYDPTGLPGVLANSPVFGKLLDCVLRFSAAYKDLSGSDLLKRLQRKTERNAREQKAVSAFRANILWGRRDRIVNPEKYDDDEEDFKDQGHIGVCKPDDDYVAPLEWVCGVERTA